MPILTLPFPAKRGQSTFAADTEFGGVYTSWRLLHPSRDFYWLDVACGEGGTLQGVSGYLGTRREEFSSWHFYGHELYVTSLHKCRGLVRDLGMQGTMLAGDLRTLSEANHLHGRFSAVSFVNALHEIGLHQFPDLILDMLLMRSDDGTVYVFDIMQLTYKEPELGATPWRVPDIQEFVSYLGELLHFQLRVFVVERTSRVQGSWSFAITPYHLPEGSRDHIINERETLSRQLHKKIIEIFSRRSAAVSRDIVRHCEAMLQIQSEGAGADATAAETRQQLIDVCVRDKWSYDYSVAIPYGQR